MGYRNLECSKKFFKNFLFKVIQVFKKKSNVLEIASNDGTFLKEFKNKGHNILGIDPAKNIARIANSKGITTISEFFNISSAKKIKKKIQPDIIFARNVIPHVTNLKSVIKGISLLSSQNTKIAIEFHYAGEINKYLQYDSIYHEHVFYFTLKSLSNLFENYKLYPIDLFESPISGGSLVLILSKNNQNKSEKLKKYQIYEKTNKLNDIKTWKSFALRVKKHKVQFRSLLIKEIEKNNKIFAYGASARSSTLLNYLNLNNNYIDFIIDQNKLKDGYYTPGSDIKIFPFSKVSKKIHNYKSMILLAWNFEKEIKKFMKYNKFKGKILMPFKKK